MATTTVQIKNLIAGATALAGTELLIEGLDNNQALPASVTRNCYSTPEAVWQDTALKAAVQADTAQVIMGGLPVPKATAMQLFNVSWNGQTLTPYRTIATSVIPANEIKPEDTTIYADVLAGATAISLPLASTVPDGKRITIVQISAGTLTITPKTFSAPISIFGVDNATLVVSLVGGTYTFVFQNGKWLLESTSGNQYAHRWAGAEYEPVIFIQTVINSQIDNWNILQTYPTGRLFRIALAGTQDITGIINPDPTQDRVIGINVLSGTARFQNNDGDSAVGNRLSIGANLSITANSFPMARFRYNTQAGVWTK